MHTSVQNTRDCVSTQKSRQLWSSLQESRVSGCRPAGAETKQVGEKKRLQKWQAISFREERGSRTDPGPRFSTLGCGGQLSLSHSILYCTFIIQMETHVSDANQQSDMQQSNKQTALSRIRPPDRWGGLMLRIGIWQAEDAPPQRRSVYSVTVVPLHGVCVWSGRERQGRGRGG